MFRTTQARVCLWLQRPLVTLRDTQHQHAAPGTKGIQGEEDEEQHTLTQLHPRGVHGDRDKVNQLMKDTMLRKLKSNVKSSEETSFRSLRRNLHFLYPNRFLCKVKSSVFHSQTCNFHEDSSKMLRKCSWRDCLSELNEARCRNMLQPNAQLYNTKSKRWAAVLVCLCEERGEAALLFTLRSAKLKGKHKGDVSFAGGKKETADRTVVDTVLREAEEELGVLVSEEQVWGVMKPLRDSTGMIIAPVIANLGPLEALSFRPNPDEVEEVFSLSLEHLCQPQNRGYTNFRVGKRLGYTLPVFLRGKHRVWGLTAVAVEQALHIVVPV